MRLTLARYAPCAPITPALRRGEPVELNILSLAPGEGGAVGVGES